ncbi:hypothetical protein IEO21_04440 [Rhodonia placenta]|uniref:RNA polymerase II degradation factor 1 n=1 Tax=Rhodonia placenta TaxID=104341 RepID=A0A8H7P3Q8_9APHY|nr:hypothetical protein IEO21_04440 [Postia placenta]
MYQSSNFRRSQPAQDAHSEKYSSQAHKLQELFPTWSNEDLQSLLTEVNGDLQLAATRISEGHAEQWGSVTRKKDKKATPAQNSHSKDGSSPRERGEFRGARGGRGGRGGPGRGGAARGAFARGGHHEANGHRFKPSQPGDAATPKRVEEVANVDVTTPTTPTNGSAKLAEEAANGWGTATTNGGWNDVPTETTASNGWVESSTPATWGSIAANGSAVPAPSAPASKVFKTPATSKLSWAQIARAQEKPATPPVPAPIAVPTPAAAPVATTAPSAAPEVTPREPTPSREEPLTEPQQQGWEEPTTVEPPTWDDEPQAKIATLSFIGEATSPPADEPQLAESQPEPAPEPPVIPEPTTSAIPAQVQHSSIVSEPVVAPQKSLTPVASTRPASSAHRISAKFKTTDQPVVMPSSNFGTGVEKIGMQFGSLSLGGEDFDASHEPAASELAPARTQEPAAAELQSAASPSVPIQQPEAPVSAVVSPPTQTPPVAQSPFPPAIPQQAQHPSQPPSQPQHSLPPSLSQSAIPVQASLQSPTPASASMSQFSHQSQASSQQTLSSHQLPQGQIQSHLHNQHQYVQHGLPTHLDPTQTQPQLSSAVPQASQQQSISPSYFRQPEAPYFHTPTPPAGQSQDTPYGSFGQLSQQVQHQAQASHLGAFSGNDYGYSENQRQNFYDSYTGPGAFGNRSVLGGHDDIKGLPTGQQQPHGAPGLPPANSQPSQQIPPASQAGSQAQPGTGQGPQQGYPPPLPYYYPYPQNQYYGSPYNSGYSVPQPYVKYPTVFQAGPPGPQSAPSPATKQPPSAVQPQSPYGQGLYGQQHPSNAYEDIGYQHHAQHSHGQSVGSGLPSNDYGKSLYGAGGQGMQGFMTLGQSTGPQSGPPLGQRAGGGSPENVYKPYAGVKDVGAGVGVGVGQGGVGQGPQSRGVPQPSQGGFYSAQRFGASASVPQNQQGQQHQPQGQGPQGHLGYPQGGSDASFYSYQPRQQQYWQ